MTSWGQSSDGDTFDALWASMGEENRAGRAGDLVAGRYTLHTSLGSGASGQVWQAEDRLRGEQVAIKLVAAVTERQRRHLRRELVALRWSRLPGLVHLRDDGPHGDDHFIVMDLVRGRPFGATGLTELIAYTRRLLEILAGLHDRGVVHRDLKPGNVLVVPDRQDVVVLDLGIATGRAVESGSVPGFAGTPAFAAPEQLAGLAVDRRADLYAVGVMLFLACTGTVPHAERDMAALTQRRQSEPAPPLASLRPDAPPKLCAVTDRLLATRPVDRFQDAWAALEALGGALPPPLSGALALPEVADLPQLRSLFHGPDAFLHLREDAAAELHRRTAGQRSAVHAEVGRWLRAGRCHWEGGAVRIGRRALVELQADPTGVWDLAVAGGTASQLANALQAVLAEADLPPERGLGLLELVVASARASGETGLETQLLVELAAFALMHEAAGPIEQALYDLGRVAAPSHELAAAERLLRAARAAFNGSREQAAAELARLDKLVGSDKSLPHEAPGAPGAPESAALPPEAPGQAALPHEELEIWRQALGVWVLRGGEHEEARLAQLTQWANSDKERRARRLGWLADLRYRQGRLREAAELHEQAAAGKRRVAGRVSSAMNAAAAWVDIGEFERAKAVAEPALQAARAARLARYEGQLTWCLRSASYRAGEAVVARPELVEAGALVSATTGRLLAMTEAAIAWRAGDLALAGTLAEAGAHGLDAVETQPAALLCRAIEVHCQGCPERGVAEVVAAAARCRVDLMAAQALWLVGKKDAARQRIEPEVGVDPDLRQEVSSLRELLAT